MDEDVPIFRMRHGDVDPVAERAAGLALDAAIVVHRALGSGLRERHYRECLLIELQERQVHVEEEVAVDLEYKGRRLESAARFDLVLDRTLLMELKAVEALHPHHFLQVRSYVRFGRFPLGILLNFHAPRLIDGWHRILPGASPSAIASLAASRRRMKSARDDPTEDPASTSRTPVAQPEKARTSSSN